MSPPHVTIIAPANLALPALRQIVPVFRIQIISTITAAGTVSAVRLEPAAQGETPLGKCIIDVARRVPYEAHDRPRVNFVQPLRVKRQGN